MPKEDRIIVEDDYESEFSLFQYNRDIYSEVETILMMPTSKNQFVSSFIIKIYCRGYINSHNII